MRRGIAILAALALAACSVDVEGAQCRVPGAAEDCPSGQACGNDLRCSARALACATAGTRCDPAPAYCVGKARVERCSAEADPVCGALVSEDCAAAGLECGTRGPAACECPVALAPTSEFAADPVAGSPRGAAPFATGAASPPVCRFKRLGDALDAAADAALAGGATSVRAHGAAGALVVFGDVVTGEQLPLEVAAGVTLHGADAPAGATVVRAEGVTATALVSLRGAIEDVRVESVPVAPAGGGLVGATGTGIATECPLVVGAPRPRIEAVAVDGGRSLTKGIEVAGGTCGADLSRVEVSRVAGTALEVAADAGVAVTVRGSTFRDSAAGVRATGGKLTIEPAEGTPSEVRGNAGEGIVITGGTATTLDVTVTGTQVRENGGTGLVLDVVSTASKLTVSGCVVYANGEGTPRRYGPGSPQRAAGGVFIRQSALSPLVFDTNRVSSNAGDQLAFEGGSWSISPGACGPASNVFGCVGANYAVGIAGGGTVDASFSVWPDALWDGYVSPGVTSSAYCNSAAGAPTPPATCPAP